MTDARLSNEFVEVAISAPTVRARLSNEFVEVALTGTTVIGRASNLFVEIGSKWSAVGAPGSLPWDPSVDSTATIPGWQPRTPRFYARPVQCEDATDGLTGAPLTDGRGILVWPTADDQAVHYAIVETPREFLVDDVVPIGDVQVLMVQPATPGQVFRATVARMGPDLFCTVMRIDLEPSQGGIGYTELWKANSASNPTAWSRWGEIQRSGALGLNQTLLESNQHMSGLLALLDNGRWLYLGSLWISFVAAPLTIAGAWFSDNGGRSWTQTVSSGFYISDTYLAFESEQIAVDPSNGYLYFLTFSPASGVNSTDIWRSVDGGVTWAAFNQINSENISAFLNDGTSLWALGGQGDFFNLPAGDDGTVIGNWEIHPEDWVPPGGMMPGGANGTTKGIVIDNAVYYFWADRVARASQGWMVGRVAIG